MKRFIAIAFSLFLLFTSITEANAVGEFCCPNGTSFNDQTGRCRANYVPPGNTAPPETEIGCVAPDKCVGINQNGPLRGMCVACDPSNPSRCASNIFCCNEKDTYSTSDYKCHTIGTPGNPSTSYEPNCPTDEVCIRSNLSALAGDQKLRGVCSLPPSSIKCDINDPLSCPNGQYCTANGTCEFNENFSFDLCNQLKGDDEKYRACDNCLRGDNGVWTALGCIKTNPKDFIADFLKLAMGIAGGIALLLMVYGSFLISTSAGDPKKAEEGKEIITGTIAGLLFIIFSVVLLRIIGVDILNIPGL